MLQRPTVIIIALVLSAIGGYLYLDLRTPEGVTPQGDSTETLAILALCTSIISMLTALFGLIHKILDVKGGAKEK
jgi:hypothetical protein